ncbi:DNA alkylation repair enzyme [Anatilimnocola aggregata]|uniref:DNA alkylation repair enzyme n=1 Tax=Anatilimnocola aggregata TaxID=2528021 RepID=A0A517YK65_9BACT|nr:DNA alkylation repair protein [Anatilimnocola aggregata]QDU30612.1 DNA alkylation repair enzyme [Anatilimnocola aggregata]
MSAKKRQPAPKAASPPAADEVIAKLKKMASAKVRDGMARYAIPADNAFGVSVGAMRSLAKKLGRNHDLAADLWKSGWYEARMLATFVDEPERVTSQQMDRWAKDFDSWAICDTACFALFDRSPFAWKKVDQWAPKREEFVKRSAFALLASLTVHDKLAEDDKFAHGLELIEQAACDERNFVKKAVNWALRSIGKRSLLLHSLAIASAQKLAASTDPTERWVGKDALRELTSPAVVKRLAKRRNK